MQQINHVVFDLGKVLVDFSYRQFLPLLRSRGAQIRDAEDFAERVNLIDYEHGRLSTGAFLRGINALLRAPLTEPELQLVWCGIFTPMPQMLHLARQLKSRLQVYILSNTGAIHWQYLCERFALMDMCKDAFPSCEVGHMKPAREIYTLAEKRFGFTPTEVVFIDDRLENVIGAQNCGWHGIQHQSYGQTCEALLELGVHPSEV
ncbi:HAD family hydrolase [Geopsychrobacter electrodiphilus]|uniref:HAD family hydrolase n=1 Tax=Geopsychrobacter electrodiphilus TaxID=225196 RepID=UPI000381045B|nr:HAD family phosphatase [Geopsychrobacter electrodiphilus]